MTTSNTPFIKKILAPFRRRRESAPDETTVFLYGDDERYAINMTIKNNFAPPNTDESGSLLDESSWDEKWASHAASGHISVANAADFDDLCLTTSVSTTKSFLFFSASFLKIVFLRLLM